MRNASKGTHLKIVVLALITGIAVAGLAIASWQNNQETTVTSPVKSR